MKKKCFTHPLLKKIRLSPIIIVLLLLLGHISCKSQKETNKINLNKEVEINTPARDILNIKSYGNHGEILLLIHGLGSDAKAWQKLIPFLENEFRIYTLELPKYLDREDKSLVSIDNYSKLVGQVIQDLGVKKIHLIGHSMGGQVAIKLALEQPDLTASLSLLAPAGFEQFSESDKKWFDTWVTKKFYLSLTNEAIAQSFDINFYESKLPTDAAFMLEDRLSLKLDPVKYSRYLDYVLSSINSMLKQTVYEQLTDIKIPTSVFFGTHDRLIPNKVLHPQLSVDDILEIASKIPNAEKHMIQNAGHFIQWDQPSEIAKHLSIFLNKNFTNE